MTPTRIRLSRAKGWRMPPNTVKVDRTTIFGNPFVPTDTRSEADCAMAFHTWLTVPTAHAGLQPRRDALLSALPSLRGKNLACWCRPDAYCHADVLLDLANA
jgi:hypothetical protein